MIGRTYLESAIGSQHCATCFNLCGQSGCPLGPTLCRLPPSPIVVLQRWGRVDPEGNHIPTPGAPRNVLIRRADGSLTIRPFRGLRKP